MSCLRMLSLLSLSLVFVGGCGGSSAPVPMAEQDELQKYAAENPSPPETAVDPGK